VFLEPGLQFEQEHSGCVGDDLFDISEDQSTESCSSQAWRGGSCFGGVKVKVWTDTADCANVMIAGFRQCRDLIGKGKTFVKYEAKVASRLYSLTMQDTAKSMLLCHFSAGATESGLLLLFSLFFIFFKGTAMFCPRGLKSKSCESLRTAV